MVIPEDSGDSALGEEGDDEMDEVECLLEEGSLQSPLTASKGSKTTAPSKKPGVRAPLRLLPGTLPDICKAASSST